MLELALRYATRGWLVLPLKPGTKIPATAHGYKDATTDLATIEDHWRRDPAANIGIVTGHASGIVVLDIDRKHGVDGVQAAAALKLPPSLAVRTPSGGFHAYFRLLPHQDVGRVIRAAPGVDVLGNGGYVVAPGSRISGDEYRIVRDASLADCPSSLLRLAQARRAPERHPTPADSIGGLPTGSRNAGLASLAGRLRAAGLSGDEISAALLRANELRCDPPLHTREVLAIAASISRYPAGRLPTTGNRFLPPHT
jgi:hypothetical protein